MENQTMGGVPEKLHTNYPSRYKIGEMVTLDFHESGKISDCKVDSVSFDEAKVYYNVEIPIISGRSIVIEKVDSICVVDQEQK